MNKTLVILAAGIGSRYGAGIKQLESVDDHGRLIIDYCIHDAIAAGMLKIGTGFSVLPTDDTWFGVTYQEDKPVVVENFRKLIATGVYQEDLYSDL